MGQSSPRRIKENKKIDPQSANRAPRVSLKPGGDENVLKLDTSPGGLDAQLRAFGTNDREFITVTLDQLIKTSQSPHKLGTVANSILTTLHGIGPRDELEALIATQMIGVHNLAMALMSRSISSQSNEGLEVNLSLVTKLLKTFGLQVEALNKYRNRGQQQVTVQHVQVSGGQAIVGQINTGGSGCEKS